ncbi:hypothetical protein T05_12686 [Trichinella murrelli]|uniref:Uncharacterized protein n=1 Tax=Trichinella murrelli TaxID=144512 RepID=A0A0V0T8K6_9BILA|nr:hypothetical protein T05_12686 [Trichinella murrelli]
MGSSATINEVRFTFSLVHRNQGNVSWCNGKHLVYIQPDASPRFPFFWNEFYRGFVVYCLPSADHLEAVLELLLGFNAAQCNENVSFIFIGMVSTTKVINLYLCK